MKTLMLLFLLVGTFSCGKNENKKFVQIPERSTDPVVTPEYLNLFNNYRMQLGLRPLTYSPIIEEVAAGHSLWMSQGLGRFGHYGWKSRCRKLNRELRSDMCGEIIAFGQKSPEAVLQAWIDSPSHRKSLENPEWTHTGLGLVWNSKGRPYWTQVFVRID